MRTSQAALLLGVAVVCALVFFGTVRYTGSDPRGALLLSDSIIFHGSFRLDHYGNEALDGYGYVIHSKNDHQYYFFPIGTSLASIPVVALAKFFGYSYAEDEELLQIVIACITAALTLIFLARLAALVLAPLNAVFLALVFWLGTAIASTGGTALWSHNFAVVFALMAVYYAVRPGLCNTPTPWHLIALLLFSAYLCRPTLALLSPFLLLFLLTQDKKAAVLCGILLALLLAAFAGWSFHEFHQPLPDYYLPRRLSGGDFSEALAGNLISPGRGLLVYSSFIAVVWLYRLAVRKKQPAQNPWWLIIAFGWPLFHLIFISRFPHWWAGHSYGSRFMMDVMPGLFLLVLMAWPQSLEEVRQAPKTAALLVLSCAFSVYVNAVQGLYNPYTQRWNSEPNVDLFPGYLFDWKFPQFLHNGARNTQRLEQHNRQLETENARLVIRHSGGQGVVFTGWSEAEPYHRWSNGKSASIEFSLPQSIIFEGTITLAASYLGQQRVTLKLNNVLLATYDSGEVKIAKKIIFDPALLAYGETNTLRFELPDARPFGGDDTRELAIALISVAIR